MSYEATMLTLTPQQFFFIFKQISDIKLLILLFNYILLNIFYLRV